MKTVKTCHKGFTRVDLAVTLLCAAFLVVTMGAVGNRGRRRAQQLVCASQLAKWGQAIIMQSADNDDKLMSMVRRWDDMPFPNYMVALPLRFYGPEWWWIDGMRKGEFSVYLIDPYLDIVSDDFENNGQVTRLLACPSTDADFIVQWCYVCWDEFCRPVGLGEYFIETAYSYWNAGGPVPLEPGEECSENALRDLTFNVLSPNRLLMSDILGMDYDFGPGVLFRYNHGVDGWCWSLSWHPDVDSPVGHIKFDGQQDATGRSQLFGDGRVQWRPISLEFEDNLPSESVEGLDENEWNGPGSGWVLRELYSWY
ncbi:MAG: hypothetical protein ACYTA5_25575 [Planctomycetota bacterium]|jgi:hypothetical protein